MLRARGMLREFGGVSPDLLAVREGFARVAAASAAGTTTAAREDTPLKLGEGEVMDVAQDYSDPRLGEGVRRAAALGRDWPSAKDAVWLGESGKALQVDLAFRAVGEEKLADFADLLKAAVAAQDATPWMNSWPRWPDPEQKEPPWTSPSPSAGASPTSM